MRDYSKRLKQNASFLGESKKIMKNIDLYWKIVDDSYCYKSAYETKSIKTSEYDIIKFNKSKISLIIKWI